ncbi:MAG: LuxR C-terminal-related transcriptional regulator [Bacteroidota bacterium]
MRLVLFFCFSLLLSPAAIWAQGEEELTPAEKVAQLKSDLASKDLDTKSRIEKLHELGQYYFDQPDSTLYFLKRSLMLSKEINDSVLISDTYINLSLVDLFKDNYEGTLKYTDSAIQHLNKRNNAHFLNLGIASTLRGIAYNNNERMDSAFENILEANSFLRKAPVDEVSRNYLIQNYSDLALIYFNIEEYENAIVSAKQALLRSKPEELNFHSADIYNTLATTYTEMQEYALAEVYLDSSLQAFSEIQYLPGIVRAYSDKGELELRREKYNSAIAEFEQALSVGNGTENPNSMASIYLGLTKAYIRNNELSRARQYLDSAEVISQPLNLPLYTHKIAIAKSQILQKERRFNEAIAILEQNVKDMEAVNLRESQRDTFEELYLLYKVQGDSENSFTYFEKYTNLKDNLKQELQNSKLNVLRVEHNYNQVVAELENTETQLKLASEEQKRVKHRNYYLGGLAALIVLFSLFMFFRQRKLSAVRRSALESKQEVLRVKKEALDNQVRFKNKQITDFAIHISEKNELLENIKAKLKSIKVTNDTYKEMVNDTMHYINNDIEQNKEKIQLYKQVNETTDSFRAKIEQMYTNLSDKEKKVATMLRLGQTSKQIALQLNISAASVDNYRYTLRKKMNIPKGESLKMFIQNI